MPSPLRRPNPMPQGQAFPAPPMGQPNQQMQGGQDSPMQRMIFNMLYQRNPNFRRLADSVRGQDPQQACQNLGVDYNQLQNVDVNQVRQMFGI